MKYGNHKEPLKLVVEGSEQNSVVAYACGVCGLVCLNEQYACQHCAERICDCGKSIEQKMYTTCPACHIQHSRERTQKQIDKAKKISWEDWDDPVYCEGIEDDYFVDVDELLEVLELIPEEERPKPFVVWACSKRGIELDAESIIERTLEEHHEDAQDDIDVESLQVQLDLWCAKQSVESWFPREDLVVVLDQKFST